MPAPTQTGSRPPDPLIGCTLGGHYRITALLGRGGMSRVYQAMQAPLDRAVALKVLKDDPNDPTLQRRFLFEASVTSQLTHPNTVTIFDYGADQGLLFFAMELLRGSTVAQALKRDGRFSEARTLHIVRQICRSLRAAHLKGLVHRDLKPSNFFLVDHGDEADFVKVLDFGLVKLFGKEDLQLTSGGLVLGTPHYMAPEQARGLSCDQRSDIYSLGVVIFQMLTGRVPFDGNSTVDVLLRHATDPVPPLREACPGVQVSAGLEAVVTRCMSKKPEARFQSMEELLSALPGDRPNGPRPPPPPLDHDQTGEVDPPPSLRSTTGKLGRKGDTREIPGARRASCDAIAQEKPPAPPPPPQAAAPPGRWGRRGALIAVAVALALALGTTVWLRSRSASAKPAAPVAVAPVVLPATPVAARGKPRPEPAPPPAAVAPTLPSPEPAPPAKAAEPVKLAEPAKVAEPVKLAEPAKMAEPVKVAKPEPEEPPAPERKPPPRRAERQVAATRRPKAAAQPSASPEVIEALNERLARAVSGVRQCAMIELHRGSHASGGEVQLSVTVEPSGQIADLQLGGAELAAKLEACIRAAVQRVRFEPFEGAAVTLKRAVSLTPR